MISQETRYALVELFHSIGEGEASLESLRQVLYEQEGFDCKKAFGLLDFMSKDFITSDDLFKFMQHNPIFTPMSCYLLLKEWDKSNRGHLKYEDFTQLILPCNCHSPRSNPAPIEKTEFIVQKLLQAELKFIINIEESKQALWRQKHFSPASCFNFIDSNGQGYISSANLEKFLQSHAITQSGFVGSILKRLDKDNDGRISYTEFIQVVTPAHKVYGNEENFTSVFSVNGSPVVSPIRTHNSPPKNKGKRQSGVKKFARFLIQQIMLEKELENKRKELALRMDFSVGKLFALFDRTGKGSIAIKDLEEGLTELGIVPELNQCHLLFRQYDRNNNNCLKFWDFCEIFTPRTVEYSDLLLSRVSSKDKVEGFSIETLDIVTDTFIVILNIQSVTEELKEKLYKSSFNVQKIYEKIDMNRLGFLTKGCFRNLLRKYKYYATEKDLDAILLVYDANKDGKITYSKFVQGLCPKSVSNV